MPAEKLPLVNAVAISFICVEVAFDLDQSVSVICSEP